MTLTFSISISEVSAVTGDNIYANDSGNNNSTITNTTNNDNTQNSSPTPTSEPKTLTTTSSNTTPTQKNNEDTANSPNNSAVTTSSTQELAYADSSVSALAASNSVNGTIVLTFDDGAESVYTYAYPIMKQYGIKGTVFVNTAFIGEEWYMTLAELQELHNAGWTVANHANEHLDLTTLSRANKVSEVQTAINWLNNNGFSDGAYYFATPYGSYNTEVLDVLRQLGIKIHRTVEDGYITNPPVNLLELPDKEINGYDGYHTLAQAKSIVDGAISANKTAMILLHEILPVIASGEDGNWQWSVSNFNGLIQYIFQTGVKTLNVNEWYQEVTGNPVTDTTPPTITSVDPTNGSTNVPINKIINITFSDAIKAGTAYNSITITNNGVIVSSITKSITNNILTLTNSANYVAGTKYVINLPVNSITDLAGNNITAFSSNFTTIDNVPPTITSIDPLNNALNVPINKIINITFNEPIKTGTAYNNINITNNGVLVSSITKSISGSVLTLTNSANYILGTKYIINLPANSITDLAGNNITAFSSNFTTIVDTTSPTINSVDPLNNAVNVPINKIINITFSEPIQIGSAYNSITITNNGAVVSGITKSISGSVLTLTNSANYILGTNYLINLPANSITDIAGNNITAFSSNFTTIQDNSIPTITGIDPTNNALNVPINKIINITFSEAIKSGTAYNSITITNNGVIVSSITKSITNNILTLTNSANYVAGTKYVISLPANSIADLAGNNITAFSSNFTTIQNTNPAITPEIVITFDDGAESIYLNAYPIMKQYGIKGTVFVNTAYIGTPWYMTLAELQELHNAGWTIASHANEHIDLTTVNQTQQISEIKTAITWLNNNGFSDGAYYFASPYGAYNDQLLGILRESGVLIHRTTNEGYITNPPANLLQLPDKEINGITGYHTLDQAKSIVNGAISANTTAMILLHEIVTGTPNDWQWSTTNFSGLIQYISQIGVKTLTVNEWYHEVAGNPVTDTTPPTITSVDPTNGSTNVAVNKVINITFSEAIKAGMAYNSITITNNGAVVSGITKSITNNILTLTNSANYVAGTKYVINLPANSIADLAGNNITAFSSNFTTIQTIQDTTPPTASADIKTGTYNVDKLITLKMNEAGTIYYTLNGTTPTKTSLIYTGPITISSTTTLKFIAYDLANNHSPVYTATYTIDKTAPIVTSTTPKNGATGVSRGSNIVIQFSENIKSSTNWSQIYVKNMKTGSVLSISKLISGNTLTISTNRRAASTLFQVYIPAGAVKDSAGNNCAAYTFSFTTGL